MIGSPVSQRIPTALPPNLVPAAFASGPDPPRPRFRSTVRFGEAVFRERRRGPQAQKTRLSAIFLEPLRLLGFFRV